MPYKRLVDAIFQATTGDSDTAAEAEDKDVSELVTALEKGRGAFGVDDIALITQALTARVDSPLVAAAGLRAVSSLACDERMKPNQLNQSVIVNEGGLSAVVAVMKKHPQVKAVQEHGCWAIATVARKHTENGIAMVQGDSTNGVWTRLRHAMITFPGDPALQEKALMAVSFLGKISLENGDRLANEGAIQMICRAIEGHPLSSPVQLQAASAVLALSESEKNRGMMLELRIHSHLSDMLYTNCDSQTVVQQAIGALISVAREPQIRMQFVQQGGAERLLAAFTFHKWLPGVVQWCCQAVAHLGEGDICQDALMTHGAVDKVMDAMTYFNKTDSTEHIQVQGQAIAAMAALCNDNARVKLHVQQVGFVKMLYHSMGVYRKHASVQEQACRFLLVYGQDRIEVRSTTLKQLIVNEKFLDRVKEAIHMNPTVGQLLESCLQVLTMLASRNERNKTEMVDEHGAITLALTSLSSHREDRRVVQAGLSLLVSLSVEPKLQPACVSAGVIPAICNVMRFFQDQAQIQLDAIWVAVNLCWSSPENREAVIEEGLLPFVVEARIRHSRNPELMDKSSKLLERVDPNLLHSSSGRLVLSRK